jgi:hypothetical protein
MIIYLISMLTHSPLVVKAHAILITDVPDLLFTRTFISTLGQHWGAGGRQKAYSQKILKTLLKLLKQIHYT